MSSPSLGDGGIHFGETVYVTQLEKAVRTVSCLCSFFSLSSSSLSDHACIHFSSVWFLRVVWQDGATALHIAAGCYHFDAIRELVENCRADVNATNDVSLLARAIGFSLWPRFCGAPFSTSLEFEPLHLLPMPPRPEIHPCIAPPMIPRP